MTDNNTARAIGAAARPAQWSDATALSQTLARAFADDPLMLFLVPGAGAQPQTLQRLFRLLFKLGLPHGACDVTDGCEAAALWRPPGHWHVPFYQYITNGLEFLGVFGVKGALRAMGTMDIIEKRHPKAPHYYLQVLGTDTVKQGKGFGGVVIRRHLSIADAKGMPCYLESTKERNIPIYQNFGFELTGEIKIPGGPTMFSMWRSARATA